MSLYILKLVVIKNNTVSNIKESFDSKESYVMDLYVFID